MKNTQQYFNDDVVALILCAGSGARTGLGYNKILHCLGGKTVLEQTLDKFMQAKVGRIFVVCSQHDLNDVQMILSAYSNAVPIIGGATRTESVRNGLKAVPDCEVICIHDGARPFVTAEIINNCIESARLNGSGIATVPVTDTIKSVNNGKINKTLARDGLYSAQTPQAFRFKDLIDAYSKLEGDFTDDSAIFEAAGYTSYIVNGDYANIKITTPRDLIGLNVGNSFIGTGFDVHRLVENRKLILGGVTIPHILGLHGHSDADVLAHAVMDALLSAAELPDIGVLFPDTDDKYKDADSLVLLKHVFNQITKKGFRIGNISSVIIAQKPKLAKFIPFMRENIAATIGLPIQSVNISATTTECLGIVGEEKGIASNAVCILFKN